ncbi:MAG TPA: hypothetical protein VFS20_28675 [Longimicrobium sp.]|nr:hypothetical protein [Longimicrobium sp.]
MSFQKRDFRELYQGLETQVRQRAPALTDWQEGSVVRSLFESVAWEMALLYEQMDLVYQAGYVDTATGANLDRVVAVLGITRNEPDFATGTVTFERDRGSTAEITIPVGTLVTTRDDPDQRPPRKGYLTLEEVRLRPGDVEVDAKVQAEERGPEMTSDSETVVLMPRPVPGVKSVRNRRPIRFLGREREGDEDLRERAKQVLLASGRASVTSIENALLGQPGVRGVRVREGFETTVTVGAPNDAGTTASTASPDERLGRGVVQVYVDGLTADNAARLRARVDEVRAAGVYVLMEPAVALNVQVVLKIEADPRVQGDELLVLERKVRDAVIRFLDRQSMGEPLLFSQLTREVLDVKGVTDLADFRVFTFRDQHTAARGVVTLSRGSDGPAGNVTIPQRTELRAGTGQRFTVDGPAPAEDGQPDPPDGDVLLAAGETEVRARVHALRQGRDGELMRTGSAVAWEPVPAGGGALQASNAAPVRLPRVRYDATAKRIDAGVEERFVPDLVRVAAGDKELTVQVLVYVATPATGGSASLSTAVQSAVTKAGTDARPDDAWATGLDTRARNAVNAAVDGFFASVRDAAGAEAGALSAGLSAETRAAVEKAIHDAATGKETVTEAEVRDAVDAVLASSLNPTVVTAGLDAPLDAAFATVRADWLPRWPADAVATAVRAGLERAAQKTISDAQTKVTDAQTDVQNKAAAERTAAAALAADAENAQKKTALANAQTALAQSQAALAKAQGDLSTATTTATRTLSEAMDAVAAKVEALRERSGDALSALSDPSARAAMLAGRVTAAPYALEVRLRTIDWEDEVLADVAWVEPTFVETVVAEPFVYTRRVQLAGTLALALPLTATEQEKRAVRDQVRQSVADLLDGLGPEEPLELDRVRALAEAHERVLRATFDPAPALAGRIARGALNVGEMEKLVLAGDAFEIRA